MFRVFGFVIQSEAERIKDLAYLYDQIDYLESTCDLQAKLIDEQDVQIVNLETITQRYKEKLRGDDEQTKS